MQEDTKLFVYNFLASPKIILPTQTIDSGGFGNSLSKSADGVISISFIKEEKLIFSEKINNSWRNQIVDENVLAGNETSLAFDKKGRPNILYIDSEFSLKLATQIGEEWDIEDVFEKAALSLNLVFDDKGNPNISFWNPEKGALFFAKKVEGKWNFEIVDAGGVGWWNSLFLDSNQNPHISYYDFENKNLLYVFFNGENWEKEVVDSGGDVGRFNSLSISSKDVASIVYFDNTYGKLKYAKKGNGGWNIETIEEGGAGERASMMTSESGVIVVSYINFSENKLKVAKRNGQAEWKIKTINQSKEYGDNSIFVKGDKDFYFLWHDFVSNNLKYSEVSF